MSPKNNNKQVSAAVRILQQKRDASARATHLMVKNDSLITYESGILGQAAGKKFFSATFLERKIMSTKTITKRIALVAASALAIAGFSAVPANASATNTWTHSLTSGTGTGTATATGKAVTGTYAPITLTFATETRPVVTLASAGVGTLAIPTIAAATGQNVTTTAVTSTGATIFGSNSTSDTPGVLTTGLSSLAGTKTLNFSATSAEAGVQTITVVGSSGTSTLTITWAAAAAASTANSTVYYHETATGTATTVVAAAPTSDSTAAVLSTAGAQRGIILVRIKDDQSPSAGKNSEITSVSVSGPGLVSTVVDGTATTGSQSATANSATITDAGYVAYAVLGSGVSGAATYTVTHTTSKGVSTVLATKVINFYGTRAATITAVQNNFVAGVSAQLGGTPSAATGSGAFTVTAKDSNGNNVGGIDATVRSGSATTAGWWIESSNTTCISKSIGVDLGAGTGATSTNNAVGVYELSIAGGAASATSGCSADVEIKYTVPTTLAVISAGKFKVAVGGTTISTLTLTPGSSSVRPGEKVTLTLTAKDSKGFAVADGDYSIFNADGATDSTAYAGMTSSASLTANPFAVAAGDGTGSKDITIVNGEAESSFFAPYFTGDVILSAKLATTTDLATALDASTLTTTVSVDASDSSSSLALDAANAATDAANNAYDEAQNATQAASDALAAVTALAAQVKTLIASVKKLTAAVAKLKK
jgi:hypothetical protein